MISVSGRKWEENEVNINLVEKISQEHNFSKILSRLIVSRDFDNEEIHLINNHLELTNIFHNNSDFMNSVKLVENAIKNKEKICVIGDYDVDGSAATALLVRFLDNIKHPFFYYIPDRIKDGYGPSKRLLQKLILKKPQLIIMVDCGSTSINEIDFLNQNKIKSLIIDHHEINKPYPKANEIINPKKNNGYIDYDYLCATSLTYFFLEMLQKKLNSKIKLRKYLIYVLLATVCDVMPLRKLNKLISIIALKEFKITENTPINEIFKLRKIKKKIDIDDLGFLIGPILNAGGRLGQSDFATQVLSSKNQDLIKNRVMDLINLNEKRKKIELNTLNEIDFKKIEKNNKDIIIYYDSSINEGILGIIASRLKELFNRPAIVITNSNKNLKSSARSIDDYNIGRVIKRAIDENIVLSGGGHKMAAGFILKKENLEDFKKFVLNDFSRRKKTFSSFKYDAEISSISFKNNFFENIKKIGPFGTSNPLPTFLFKEFKVLKSKILNKKHISCILKSRIGFSINSISFNSFDTEIGEYLLNYKKRINVVGQISENFWDNKKKLQIIIKDLII